MIRWETKSLKGYEFNTHLVRDRKKLKVFSDDILTFDIEVTSAWLKDDKLIPYEPGHDADYWNDLKRYAIPYIWQFSINETIYYGRELQEFKEVLEELPKETHFTIYVHNLAYEFMFLLNIFKPKDIFATNAHKVIKCTWEGFEHIEFKCSYILTNMSLAIWGDQLGLPKLVGELDYLCMRSPNTPLFDYELEYCERDCQVVYLGIKDHLKQYKHIEQIPLTSTGKVRRVFKNEVTADDEYMKQIRKLVPESARFYKMLKFKLFQGGYTHGNRRFVGKVIRKDDINKLTGKPYGIIKHKDIRSSYPAVMCGMRFPYTKWAYIGRKLPDPKYFDDRAYIIKVCFKGLKCTTWNTYLSSSKCVCKGGIYDNGRILKAEECITTLTEQDYMTVIESYEWDDIEPLGCYVARKKYLPKIFIDFILQLYNDKTALKGINPVKYAISKQYINSMFGMCVTSLFQSEVKYDQKTGEWIIEELKENFVNEQLKKLTMFWNKKYFLSYSVGIWITSYARRQLWKMILSIDDDLIYTDTDSIFYVGEHDFSWFDEEITEKIRQACSKSNCDFSLSHPIDPKGRVQPLGTLDDEPDCDAFITLGAKKYCEQRGDKLYMTVSGINKSAVSCLNSNISNFKDGFIFDKDHPDVHKLEHCYISNMEPVKWIDNYYSDFKYGINMRPTGYKLSEARIGDKLNKIMANGFSFKEDFLKRRRSNIK